MERYTRTDKESKRNGRSVDNQHGVVWQGSRDNFYAGNGEGTGSAGLAECDGLGRSEHRCEHFEPVTVRAPARVLLLQRSSVVSVPEARFYLQELAAMDRHARAGAYPSLLRLAQSHLAARPSARAQGGVGSEPNRKAPTHRVLA